jgi:hypothetical protein
MKNKVRVFVLLVPLTLLVLVGDRIAMGQAGSTGGTIGKTEKSASGGEEAQPATSSKASRHASRRTGSKSFGDGCGRIIGVWTWRISIPSWRIVVKPNGVAYHSIDNGIKGAWSCDGDKVVFVWADGRYLDHVTLLPDANRLEGTNINGTKFTGTRE